MTLLDLYSRAESQGVEVDDVPLRALSSASFAQGWIVLDTSRFSSSAEHKAALAHELGHVETGSFYNIYSGFDLRSRCETRADKRAVEMLLPFSRLARALRSGLSEPWQIAEHFNLPEPFVLTALKFYQADILTLNTPGE